MENIIEHIKKNEDDGFKTGGMPYNDSLGKLTIGYGTLLPLSEVECELLLLNRLNDILGELNQQTIFNIKVEDLLKDLDIGRLDVLLEMAYQLGVPKLMKFKKMWKAIKEKNYNKASIEMIDSRWYSQTPKRAGNLAKKFQTGDI